MSSKQIVEVQEQLYKDMHEKFSLLVDELTTLVEESQKKVDKYKSNLESSTIPNAVIIMFIRSYLANRRVCRTTAKNTH